MTKKSQNHTNNTTPPEKKPCLYDFIQKMPGYIYTKDLGSVYAVANDAFLQLAGLDSVLDLIGKTDRDLPWKERYDEYRKNDLYVIETGESINCEEIIKISDDDIRVFITEKKPLKNNEGKIIGIFGNSLDITESKKIEALQKNKEIAEKTLNFMSMLARNIAYELRTPLSIIKLNLDLLECSYFSDRINKAEKETILLKTIELINHVIQANTSMLENILITLNNVVKGKIDNKHFMRTSINENIEDTLAHYPFANKERTLIEWHKEQDFSYFGNDLLTRHVLFNLLQNSLHAIKDTDEGKITIELKNTNKYNQLIFRDIASGIGSDNLSTLFERFENNDPSEIGLGLGLAFCKMIMQAYGGNITCNSQKDKFTEFVLSFPKIN